MFKTWQTLKEKGVLGINERNLSYLFLSNERHYFPNVDNKLLTKELAIESEISAPELYHVVKFSGEVARINEALSARESFVIKPCRGSCGEGILVIKGRRGENYIKSSGDLITPAELEYHVRNILSGLFSLGSQPDVAMVEALVVPDEVFEEISYQGVPDIRIIVYKGLPVMAMLRLPTRQSGGKANLHQGAVGAGVRLKSGEITSAVLQDRPIYEHPDTGVRISGKFVPDWERFLNISAKASTMCKLGYLGVDLVLDKKLGPMLLEVNARPGLSIQIANNNGLRKRLDKIEELHKKGLKWGENSEEILNQVCPI